MTGLSGSANAGTDLTVGETVTLNETATGGDVLDGSINVKVIHNPSDKLVTDVDVRIR